jgi:hypothetical protein
VLSQRQNLLPGSPAWWEAILIYGNTVEGAGKAVELDVALQVFAEAVEAD